MIYRGAEIYDEERKLRYKKRGEWGYMLCERKNVIIEASLIQYYN